jgi:hypothetical protein
MRFSKQDPFVIYNKHCNFGVDVGVDNQYISTSSSWMLTIPVPWIAPVTELVTCAAPCEARVPF